MNDRISCPEAHHESDHPSADHLAPGQLIRIPGRVIIDALPADIGKAPYPVVSAFSHPAAADSMNRIRVLLPVRVPVRFSEE